MLGLFRQRVKLGVTVFALIILLALFLVPVPTLLVSVQNGNPVLVLPVLWEKTFTLEFTHSVLKTPVQEHFVLAPDNELLLTSTTYKSLGVGLPFLPEEGKLVNEHGVFVLTGLDRHFQEINQGFMPLAKQALLFGGKRYDFKDYFKPGSLVRLQVKQYTPAKIIWQKLTL